MQDTVIQDCLTSIRRYIEDNCTIEELSKKLSNYGVCCPSFLKSLLDSKQYFLNLYKTKKRIDALLPVLLEFDFNYAIVKGPVLSLAAYGNPYVRVSNDLDVLISHENLERAQTLLYNRGFVQAKVKGGKIIQFSRKEKIYYNMLTHQTPPFIKKIDSVSCPLVCVDVNTKFMFSEAINQPNVDFILEHVEYCDLGGFKVKKLICELDFIFTCLHHYKDAHSIYLLSKGSLRLDLFFDIYFYLTKQDINFDKLAKLCKELNVGKYIYVMIYYTNKIFNDNQTKLLLTLLQDQRDDLILNTYGLSTTELKTWDIDFFERLFHQNLPTHFLNSLTEQERQKIKINEFYM